MFEYDIIVLAVAGLGVAVAFMILFWWLTFRWKVKAIVLRKLPNNSFFKLYEKTFYRECENVTFKDFTYSFTGLPTYFVGTKRVYFFVEGNASPLSFNQVHFEDALILKRIVKDNVIFQLVRASVPPRVELDKILPYLVVLAIVVIVLFMFAPNISQLLGSTVTPTATRTVPTLTPPRG